MGLPPQGAPEAPVQVYYHVMGTALRQNLFCCKPTSAIYPQDNSQEAFSDPVNALEKHLPPCLNNYVLLYMRKSQNWGGLSCLFVSGVHQIKARWYAALCCHFPAEKQLTGYFRLVQLQSLPV